MAEQSTDRPPLEVKMNGTYGVADADEDQEFYDANDFWMPLEILDLQQAFGGDDEGSGASAPYDYDQFDIGEVDLKLFKDILKPRHVLLKDKIAFVIGSTQLWTTAYWLGYSPVTFYRFYTAEALLLFSIRWAIYRHKKAHYYMFDFCYYANVLLLLHLWLWPRSELLMKILFAYCTGPLAWSIVTFRNSLVYHDLDKVTSVFLHLVPSCVAWTLRWHPDTSRFGPSDPHSEADRLAWSRAGFVDLVVIPIIPYLVWAVAYYLKIFVISARKIQQKGYATLFNYVTGYSKSGFQGLARRTPPRLQPVVYLSLHLLFCCTTFVVSIACWHSFHLHSALLIAMSMASIWHGANFYFEVFAHRYLSTLGLQTKPPTPAGTGKPRAKVT